MKTNGRISDTDHHPIGIWIRVSHENSVKDESPEHHEHRARAYAEFKGWDIAEVYRLDAVSGKSVKDLPETKRMLNDIRSGRIKGLIFSKLARLARNTRELLEFADIFQEYEADLISLQEAIDTSTPAGRLFYTMIAALAQWEREETSARVAASVPVRAALGKPTGGQAPFGYRWVNKQLEIDPDEAPIRKLMYELFLEHRRKKTVADLLNEAGYRTRRGAHFSDTTVDRLLKDPISKGKRRANYTKSTGEGKHWELKPESEWIYTDVEPVVTEELWNQVNSILEKQYKKRKRTGRKPVHLFAGVTVCQCGTNMYVPSNTPKYVCRKCRNKIPIDDLETVFYEQLKKFFFTPEDVASFLSKADDEIKRREELLSILEDELRSVESEMEKVYRLYVDDELSAQGFGRMYSPLEERQKQLEDEIPRVQGELDFLKIKLLSSDDIVSNAQSFYSKWPDLEFEEKRRIVENLVHRIEIKDATVLIELAFAPPSPDPSLPKELSTNQHNYTVALISCHLHLEAVRPVSDDYPTELKTIGDYIRKTRMDKGLTQQDVAKLVQVSESTVWKWEAGLVIDPEIKSMPAIIDFLGYVPIDVDSAFYELLLAYRAIHGYTQKEASRAVGVDPTTWGDWENGGTSPSNRRTKSIARNIAKDVYRHVD